MFTNFEKCGWAGRMPIGHAGQNNEFRMIPFLQNKNVHILNNEKSEVRDIPN